MVGRAWGVRYLVESGLRSFLLLTGELAHFIYQDKCQRAEGDERTCSPRPS